jgi:hypothetical protein
MPVAYVGYSYTSALLLNTDAERAELMADAVRSFHRREVDVMSNDHWAELHGPIFTATYC